MGIGKPRGVLAGFHAMELSGVPEIQHIGEHWAPAHLRIGLHAHDVWELLLQLSGEAVWESADGAISLRPGDLFVVAPGVPHVMRRPARTSHHYLYAAVDLAAVWQRQPELRSFWSESIWHHSGAESLVAPFRALAREASRERPHRAAALRCTLDLLLIEATRLMATKDTSIAPAIAHPAVAAAREHLDGAPERDWKLADLARLSGLSPTHFAEIFARDVGEPPHRYILRKRLERARELLAGSEIPVTDLALELGFSSGQHFATAFRRYAGTTPRAYRSETRKG